MDHHHLTEVVPRLWQARSPIALARDSGTRGPAQREAAAESPQTSPQEPTLSDHDDASRSGD